jgi:hypothetical protein
MRSPVHRTSLHHTQIRALGLSCVPLPSPLLPSPSSPRSRRASIAHARLARTCIWLDRARARMCGPAPARGRTRGYRAVRGILSGAICTILPAPVSPAHRPAVLVLRAVCPCTVQRRTWRYFFAACADPMRAPSDAGRGGISSRACGPVRWRAVRNNAGFAL